ncbi:hypothetical protein [Microlunatus sp. GCM10028923]|uniref:hypothetical protein n=1 Tax=Microlunatus sp. GCM10028923 TaxID=3273400 RepID=UPI0036705FE0
MELHTWIVGCSAFVVATVTGTVNVTEAACLGVEPDSIGLVRNVSEGVSSVLASLELTAGDELVLSNHGYGAVRIAAQNWADRRGAMIKIAEFELGARHDEIIATYAGHDSYKRNRGRHLDTRLVRWQESTDRVSLNSGLDPLAAPAQWSQA